MGDLVGQLLGYLAGFLLIKFVKLILLLVSMGRVTVVASKSWRPLIRQPGGTYAVPENSALILGVAFWVLILITFVLIWR